MNENLLVPRFCRQEIQGPWALFREGSFYGRNCHIVVKKKWQTVGLIFPPVDLKSLDLVTTPSLLQRQHQFVHQFLTLWHLELRVQHVNSCDITKALCLALEKAGKGFQLQPIVDFVLYSQQ